jgi:N-acetyl-anhydromuramyl-L-alanine amidase AmpD
VSTAITVRGESVPVSFDVVGWFERDGLSFPVRKNRTLTRACVVHWTGAENPPEAVVRNMQATRDAEGRPAPTSVHFIVAADGLVYQCADTEARMSHAKAHNANDWTVGIEVVCRGDNFASQLRTGTARPRYTDFIQGRRCMYDSFNDAQLGIVILLVETLCSAYQLPVRVPLIGNDVAPCELGPRELARFHGVLGHMHLEERKRDPGVRVLRAIHEHGQALAPPPGVA